MCSALVGLHLLTPNSSHSLHSSLHQNMPQDISKSLGHNLRELPSIAKAVAKSICRHPLYISYLIFFSPYILKLIYFLSPLLILLLATALCTFIATASTNNSFFLLQGQENASGTLLEAEAYKIIFDTFHDSLTTLADESDEVVASKLIKTEASMPEIVKSCCSSSPLHQIAAETTICDKVELPCSAENPRKTTNCDETEIIKHMVCSTITKPDEHEQLLKSAVGVEIDQAEEPPTTMKTQKSGSNAAIPDIQPPNSAVLRKTSFFKTSSKSYDFSSVGSLRREKEWTRTLACKLFEERHNSGAGREGEDGMDMLWETYESIDSPDDDQRRTMSRRSSRDDTFRVSVDEEDEGGEDDGDGDADVASETMCCLQALKMSSGKVNLGIGRKNMMKFSKALRRFGWLHKTKPTSMPRLEINTLE